MCQTSPKGCTCQTACKSVKRFKQSVRMWRTGDRKTGGQATLWRNDGIALRCKNKLLLWHVGG